MRAKSFRLPLPVLRAFDAIYARIPALVCKGLCHDSCGVVPMSAFEWARLVARHGKEPGVRLVDPADGKPWCPFLTAARRCEHHAERPLLCRLWGTTEGMPCPHGCRPVRYLTDEEAYGLLREADEAGGGPTSRQIRVITGPLTPEFGK
jgi:hypothetical protein